jgi:hypothetical protein
MQEILKRIAVWAAEIALEALLLGLLYAGLFGYDPQAFVWSWLTYAVAIITMMFVTGYLITTVVSRAVWKVRKLWPYSVVAAALFVIHFEVMNIGVRGAFDPRNRVYIWVAGTCIASAITFVGSIALRRWALERSTSVQPHR